MSETTKIEWTSTHNPDGTVTPGATWNPIIATRRDTGKRGWHCEKVSPACDHCYAAGMNKRSDGLVGIGTGLNYAPDSLPKVDISLHEKTLLAPLKWKRGRKIFVCSMTDAFGDWVPDEMLDRMFAVAALCPQHDFQFLTKRPERAFDYVESRLLNGVNEMIDLWHARGMPGAPKGRAFPRFHESWPLPNVWMGVTAENQEAWDLRIPILLQTPAAVRFVSCEPLLGPVDVRPYLATMRCLSCGYLGNEDIEECPSCASSREYEYGPIALESGSDRLGSLDWIIAGGESGPKARPTHPDWARSLRDQCQAAGVSFFWKQWGAFSAEKPSPCKNWTLIDRQGNTFEDTTAWNGKRGADSDTGEEYVYRVGKKAAGRLLDGREWNEFPAVKA